MPTGGAYSYEHLVPTIRDLHMLVETNPFPESVVIVPDYAFRTSLGTFSILPLTQLTVFLHNVVDVILSKIK